MVSMTIYGGDDSFVHSKCTPFKTGLPSKEDILKIVTVIPQDKIDYIKRQAVLCGIKRDPNAGQGRKRTHDEMVAGGDAEQAGRL